MLVAEIQKHKTEQTYEPDFTIAIPGGIILGTHEKKMPSQLLTDLFQPLHKDLFQFYDVAENDIDLIWEQAGSYLPTEKHIYMPAGAVPRIEHEVAHFLEMSNIKRILYKDMGMEMIPLHHKMEDFNTLYCNNEEKRYSKNEIETAFNSKSYLAALIRELKVREIQKILLQEITSKDEAVSFKDLKYNTAWEVPAKNHLWDGQKQFEEWAINLTNQTRRAWTEEKVRFEFTRRVEYVQEWQATKKNHNLHPSIAIKKQCVS